MNFQEDLMEGVQAYISKKSRDKISKEDFADPEHEKYPIRTQEELDSAVKLYGRSKDVPPEKLKKAIIRIAKRKGFTLPDSWK